MPETLFANDTSLPILYIIMKEPIDYYIPTPRNLIVFQTGLNAVLLIKRSKVIIIIVIWQFVIFVSITVEDNNMRKMHVTSVSLSCHEVYLYHIITLL